MADIIVRRAGDQEDDGGAVWHATVAEDDATEVVEVHVDAAVEDADVDVDRLVAHRVETELEQLRDAEDPIGELRERGPIYIGGAELDGWQGLSDR